MTHAEEGEASNSSEVVDGEEFVIGGRGVTASAATEVKMLFETSTTRSFRFRRRRRRRRHFGVFVTHLLLSLFLTAVSVGSYAFDSSIYVTIDTLLELNGIESTLTSLLLA